MGGSQKSKRITWAPDVNLCQVRLFSTAKPPSEIGMGTRAYLQAKASHPLQSGGHQPDDTLPTGFQEIQPANLWRVKSSQIPVTKWRCPPRFEVNSEWQVVSGEESKEIESQNERERRVLEAIYPWPSAIPQSPHAPVDAGESIADDRNTPLVPLTPIEDTDAGLAATSSPMIPQPQHLSNGNLSSQCSRAAVAAGLASVLSNSSNGDQSNLIDRDLLLRILSNPKMLQQQKYVPELKTDSTNIAVNRGAPLNATPTTAAAGPCHPPQLRTGFVIADVRSPPSPSKGVPAMKDMNYYKSLIQQHGGGGGERRDVPPQSFGQSNGAMGTSLEYTKFRDESKSRMIKPCIYFKSPRGCRNGANCAYQHDTMSSRQRVGCITEVPSAKRVKLSR